MNKAYQAVFFDLDGTLIDTAPDFRTVLNRMLRDHELPPLPLSEVRRHVSHGARAVICHGFDIHDSDPQFDDLLNGFLDRYAEHLAVDSRLFDGLNTLLLQLEEKQIPWGIVTNKPLRFTAPLLEQLGLATRVGPVICPDHVKIRKPDPEGLLIAAAETGIAARRCIYIGDHLRDIQAGKNAGMLTVGVGYGYLDNNETAADWQADITVQTVPQLSAALHPLLGL